jgi:hypothetical protein
MEEFDHLFREQRPTRAAKTAGEPLNSLKNAAASFTGVPLAPIKHQHLRFCLMLEMNPLFGADA